MVDARTFEVCSEIMRDNNFWKQVLTAFLCFADRASQCIYLSN